MKLEDYWGKPIYLNTGVVFKKPIKSIIKEGDGEDARTVITYVDGEIAEFSLEDDSHEEVIDKAESYEAIWQKQKYEDTEQRNVA